MNAEWLCALPGHESGRPLSACDELALGSDAEVWRLSWSSGVAVLKLHRATDPAVDRTRARELQAFAAEQGLAPRLLESDSAGRWDVSAFVPGTALSAAELATPATLIKVVSAMATLHRRRLPAEWAARPGWRFDMSTQLKARVRRLRAAGKLTDAGGSEAGEGRIESSLAAVARRERPMAALHLDLHAGNIVLAREPVFLDWDYAALGDPLWDLASLLANVDVPLQRYGALLQAAGRDRDASVDELLAATDLYRLLNELWRCEHDMTAG